MAKLSEKQRTATKELLEDYEKITAMLYDIPRRQFVLSLTSETDDHDFEDVKITRDAAKTVLENEKLWTEKELRKLGIEVAD